MKSEFYCFSSFFTCLLLDLRLIQCKMDFPKLGHLIGLKILAIRPTTHVDTYTYKGTQTHQPTAKIELLENHYSQTAHKQLKQLGYEKSQSLFLTFLYLYLLRLSLLSLINNTKLHYAFQIYSSTSIRQ